jgi:transcriptional regulator with XRE-family HTH domain
MTQPVVKSIPAFTLGDRLAKARKTAGLDQRDLARVMELSPSTIGNYENDISRPRRLVLKEWALVTGVPVEWLENGHTPDTSSYRDLDMTALLAPRAAPEACAA